jgi:hypothetical protein
MNVSGLNVNGSVLYSHKLIIYRDQFYAKLLTTTEPKSQFSLSHLLYSFELLLVARYKIPVTLIVAHKVMS